MAEMIKEETFYMKEELHPSSTDENTCTVYVQTEVVKKNEFKIKEEISPITVSVQDTCSVYIKEEDVKMENIGDQGIKCFYFILNAFPNKKNVYSFYFFITLNIF